MFALTATLAVCSVANAATVAYWDFEDGTAGQEFTPVGDANGSGGSVDTANGILMRGYNEEFGPNFTSATSDLTGLAMDLVIGVAPNTTSDGYVTEGALHGWSPEQWTIETQVMLRDVNGWRTMVGRDGSTQSEPESDFYLVKNGIDNQFRLNYDTVGGQRWILDGQPAGGVQPDTWYGVAATSDGQTLSLLINEGEGYQVVSTLDITAQTVADNAIPNSALNWTFGRGWYNGGFVDHVDGIMDNVRFSDVALGAGDLIPLAVVPEPAAAVLILLSLPLAACRRR
ncbi:hypothetical protein Pla123a_31670 [Posidoniimonas polymericola]|uniref:LamG-like jellyroll fold domain-containing protein n=1 Tax=Posidoniimonas polymericola TaxID=2528002 RepID=A0A5C5YLE7_9BACT|nr:LamG domain-containing protein [Posidoniimonas polymericola]TWT75657.1 hypothetical protein Pla123a_31670 [Posidoniimonas polymericola]